MTLDAHQDIGTNLRAAMEARKLIGLYLRSGSQIVGIVRDVGPHLVAIGEIVDKDFFNAIVRIDDICALSYGRT